MQVGNLMKVLNLFRQKEEDIPIGTILAFLYLMDRGEATVSNLDSYFNLGKSRASRNMRNLTDRARPGKAGIGVASYEPDPNDFRVAIFKLNDEGEQLAQEIRDLLKASGLRTET
ncbi:DNA-binding MarR family transcriptional regulator [Marinobacter sp. MBR-99]|jgi:DNA-binding MarR family transcriptional regulator|uniref:hypothetical protein n=1 Tax=unclassified Marinobacter TaxID=83889 RepID=UPI001268C8FA|nr:MULTISPECIES: hypothetical protein [unclassified Marinobacter]QFS88094.1 hypothetical protein FIV08_14765 [Marinobacter sp. THAF197a]QFT51879.1 hypothetical protein FIU96_14675 [Marinobacter sp. THAF39]